MRCTLAESSGEMPSPRISTMEYFFMVEGANGSVAGYLASVSVRCACLFDSTWLTQWGLSPKRSGIAYGKRARATTLDR